jgi:hypothetical protein
MPTHTKTQLAHRDTQTYTHARTHTHTRTRTYTHTLADCTTSH